MTFNASWKRRLRRQTVKGIRAGAQALREADLPESRGIPCHCSMTFNASWKRRLRRQTVKRIEPGRNLLREAYSNLKSPSSEFVSPASPLVATRPAGGGRG